MTSLTYNTYNRIKSDLKENFKYKNDLEIPKLKFISINTGIKAVDSDNKTNSYILSELSKIAGQKAVYTYSTKAISGFKLRQGMVIGCKVTLRGKKMYQFLDRMINISLPRIRDFRGLSSKGFNGSAHYSFGIKDHSIFLEVDLDNIVKIFGMNINIISTAKSKEEAIYLLKKLNLPLK
jgi:large subunit ribosomal protein L5